jgi:hypothetical protein
VCLRIDDGLIGDRAIINSVGVQRRLPRQGPDARPERDWKPGMPGMVSIVGRNVVERERETVELELVLAPAIDRIVRMEPVGDCASD